LLGVVGNPPTANPLKPQIGELLDRAPDREERFIEIIDQHDGEGAISYYLGMLMIDPSRHPKTYLLVRVARRIGELVVMCLKDHFHCPRPSQISPLVVPMVDPPATPSFPSGHALQARLITRCLENARSFDAAVPAPNAPPTSSALRYLAFRIAENRLIAGLHFSRDNEAGVLAADWLFTRLTSLDNMGNANHPCFAALLAAAAAEAPAPGGVVRCNQQA
jgi:membrane-associated phospholipid phosphatase